MPDFLTELEYDIKNWATADEVLKSYPELKQDNKLIWELHYDITNGATIDEIKTAYPEVWTTPTPKSWLSWALSKSVDQFTNVFTDTVPAIWSWIKQWLQSFWWDISKLQRWEFKKEILWQETDTTWIKKGLVWNIFSSAIDREKELTKRQIGQWDTGATWFEKGFEQVWQWAWLLSDVVWQTVMSWLSTATTDEQKQQFTQDLQTISQSEIWKKGIAIFKDQSEWFAEFERQNPRIASIIRTGANIWILGLDVAWWWATKQTWKKILSKLETPINIKPTVDTIKQWVGKISKPIVEWTWKLKNKIITIPKVIKDTAKWLWDKIEVWTEKLAGKALWSKSWTKELFQAASPSYQTLGKDKNILNIWKNIEKADKTVLKYGHTPTNTESRALAYKDSMKKVWSQVDEARGWTPTKVNAKTFADEIENFIETKKINGQINPEHLTDIKALQSQADYFRKLNNIDVPTLWQIRADLNAMTSFKVQNPFWDVYNTGLKNIWATIRKTENALIESYKWTKFGNLMQEYRALAETYPDIIKANIKNMRKKGASLEESFSRISWVWDVLKGSLDIVTKWQQGVWEVAKWVWKITLWKIYWKLKDPDFLVKEWFKKLSKTLKPKIITNVRNNVSPDIPSVTKHSKKPTKVSGQNRGVKTPVKKPIIKKPEAKAPAKKIITPKVADKVIKKPQILAKTKNLWDNKITLSNKTKIMWEIENYSKAKNPAQLEKVATNITKELNIPPTKFKQVVEIIKTYLRKEGLKLKDKLWDMLDEIAQKTGTKMNFMSDKWTWISWVKPKIIKTPTKSAGLIEEAKKYKSADEFVKAQGETLYRWWVSEWVSFSTQKQIAEDFAKNRWWNVNKYIIDKKANIAEYSDFPQKEYKNTDNFEMWLDKKPDKLSFMENELEVEFKKATNWAKNNWYDGIRLPVEDEVRIINKNIIKTESQLKQIYEQAKKTIIITPQKLKPVKELDTLIEEAKKYKNTNSFIKWLNKENNILWNYLWKAQENSNKAKENYNFANKTWSDVVKEKYYAKSENIDRAIKKANELWIKVVKGVDNSYKNPLDVIYFELPEWQVSFHYPDFNTLSKVKNLVQNIDNYKWSWKTDTENIINNFRKKNNFLSDLKNLERDRKSLLFKRDHPLYKDEWNRINKELDYIYNEYYKFNQIYEQANKSPIKTPTKSAGLIEEAKKYKSADEFVKAQGETLYRWW